MDDSSDLQLEAAIRVDELAAEYARLAADDPELSPEAFVRQHPDVPGDALLAVIRGAGALRRTVRRSEGPFPPGTSVGPYRVRDVIGRGGMGIVYDAVETELDRGVALKAMDALASDERTKERFSREARAAARLDHASIVPVFGSGETDGVLWYAMRRVEGASLDSLLRDLDSKDEGARSAALRQIDGAASSVDSVSGSAAARLSTRARAAVSIVQALAHALAYAHAQGILHRDIKPANVLIDRGGAALLTDFGLCKVESDPSLTQAGDLVGTLRYMPPEALEGSYDVRGEVYSLGLVLYESIVGQPAFVGDSRQSILSQVLSHDPPPLQKVVPNAPEDLARVVAKATSKLPEERYATAADFADDLEAILRGLPVRARRPSAMYLARLFVRRNRALAATVFAAMLALVVGATLYVVQLRGAFQRTEDALELAKEREAGMNEALALSAKSVAEARIAGAEATLRAGDVAAARGLVASVDEEHRDWMWRHLWARCGEREFTSAGDFFGLEGAVEASDGKRLATFGSIGVMIRSRRGLELERSLYFGARDACALGDELLLLATDGMALHRLDLGAEGEVAPARVATFESPVAQVAAVGGAGTLLLLDDAGGLVTGFDPRAAKATWARPIVGHEVRVVAPLDGSSFVVGTSGGGVFTGSSQGEDLTPVARHGAELTELLAEDGELIASGAQDGSLILYPGATGHARVHVAFESAVLALARSRAHPHLIAVGLGARVVAIVDARHGNVLRRAAGFDSRPAAVFFGEDPWLTTATYGSEVTGHPDDDHDGRFEVTMGFGDCLTVAASPDGERLYSTGTDGLLVARDLASGQVAATFVPSGALGARPSVHPDGRKLALGPLLLDAATLDPIGELGSESHLLSHFTEAGDLVSLVSESPATQGSREMVLGDVTARLWSTDGDPTLLEEEPAGKLYGVLERVISSEDGERLFVLSTGADVLCLETQLLAKAWSTTLVEQEAIAMAFDERSDELFVACRDGRVYVIDAATGEQHADRTFRIAPGVSRLAAPSDLQPGPVEGWLTSCTSDGRVDLWECATGRRVGGLAGTGTWLRHVAPVGSTGWLCAAGRHGRAVLFGSGEGPVGPGAVSAPGFDLSDALERIRDDATAPSSKEPLLQSLLASPRFSFPDGVPLETDSEDG